MSSWYQGWAKDGIVDPGYEEAVYKYLTLDQQSTEQALEHLAHATLLRMDGKPEKWARDVEYKALRRFEHSYSLRHMFDLQKYPRPDFLPPSSYSNR